MPSPVSSPPRLFNSQVSIAALQAARAWLTTAASVLEHNLDRLMPHLFAKLNDAKDQVGGSRKHH